MAGNSQCRNCFLGFIIILSEKFFWSEISPYKEKMPTYNLRGINVDFPYEAYDCQLVYMEKVIQALQTVRSFFMILFMFLLNFIMKNFAIIHNMLC